MSQNYGIQFKMSSFQNAHTPYEKRDIFTVIKHMKTVACFFVLYATVMAECDKPWCYQLFSTIYIWTFCKPQLPFWNSIYSKYNIMLIL